MAGGGEERRVYLHVQTSQSKNTIQSNFLALHHLDIVDLPRR